MMHDNYERAYGLGKREYSRQKGQGGSGYLPVLDEIAPNAAALPAVPLHLVSIPLNRVAGTATRGRTTAFAANFMPILSPKSEFADKWENLYRSVVSQGVNAPIKAYEYLNQFYVIEGNKRVSVMKYLDAASIEGEVTRLLPPQSDDPQIRVYYEFLGFYEDTSLNVIYFSRPGGFARLYAFTGTKPGEKWPEELRLDVRSAFYHFSTCYRALGGGRLSMTEGDAFLVYLGIYGFERARDSAGDEMKTDVRKIWDEITISAQDEQVVMVMEPKPEEDNSLFSALLRPRRLKAAFLYNRDVSSSGWTYWHDMGRRYVDDVMEGRVETRTALATTEDEAFSALEDMAEDGVDVVFTTSPLFLSSAIRQSVRHAGMKILNCSLQAAYHHVRSYYLRVYEAKFVLGAIAGALCVNDRVGYIADYPIYGTPTGINAFALGARLVNPRVQVFLQWSGLKDTDPADVLLKQGVRIICNRDVTAPAQGSREFGLYRVEADGSPLNLAAPVLNWGTLYETILSSVFSGGWQTATDQAQLLAMAYWPGMSTGAIDVICSRRLPDGTAQLAGMLRDMLRAGHITPFSGRIVSQDGVERAAEGEALTPAKIVAMDWLADNVVGSIPRLEDLRPEAQPLVRLQGLYNSEKPDTEAIAWTE